MFVSVFILITPVSYFPWLELLMPQWGNYLLPIGMGILAGGLLDKVYTSEKALGAGVIVGALFGTGSILLFTVPLHYWHWPPKLSDTVYRYVSGALPTPYLYQPPGDVWHVLMAWSLGAGIIAIGLILLFRWRPRSGTAQSSFRQPVPFACSVRSVEVSRQRKRQLQANGASRSALHTLGGPRLADALHQPEDAEAQKGNAEDAVCAEE